MFLSKSCNDVLVALHVEGVAVLRSIVRGVGEAGEEQGEEGGPVMREEEERGNGEETGIGGRVEGRE